MKTYWQAEFTDFRGAKTLFRFKFPTKTECEQFIQTQRRPNMRAVEVVPEDPRPEPAPEPIDRDPGDEAASVEGGDAPMTASEVLASDEAMARLARDREAAAELTRQRKCAALAKARAAKAAKMAARREAAALSHCDRLLPTHYTISEGCGFILWGLGSVAAADLLKRSRDTVVINGVDVHALAFPTQHPEFWARWDCVNGWTPDVPANVPRETLNAA